ncbi:hypothetical protein [Tardiphaga sp. 367_B4_N1_1]|uniref:hypothetical protein n=1 Tax=Tardiphaga sp. 367_B4_N1_1 TaxID=3240777 RepID=UPI003F240B8B
MALSVPIDTRDITVTPIFKHITVENVPASEREGHPVMEVLEVVEVRFAGSKLYSPVFPANAFWKRDGHRTITYAERWADQYREFLSGNDQKAAGTPLEMLKPYGISDAQLSLCRALRIYSIEALHHLEGPNLKSLQMNANPLKEMARRYMSDRSSGSQSADKIAELMAEVAALKSQIPAKEPTLAEVEQAIQAAEDEYEAMSDDQLKEAIAAKVGSKPRGNPSRATLLSSIRELSAA